MHPNPIFRKTSAQRNLDLARQRGFGALSVNGDGAPLVAYTPFVLAEDDTAADIHLVASNPVWRAVEQPMAAVLIVQGPDGYISPDWYGIDDMVPTWNYIAVHLRGTLRRLDQAELRSQLDRLSAQFETRLAPKPEWTTDKMAVDAMERFMRMIRPVRLEIETVEGTWKLGQNKPDAARFAAADQLGQSTVGQQTAALADLMRQPPED